MPWRLRVLVVLNVVLTMIAAGQAWVSVAFLEDLLVGLMEGRCYFVAYCVLALLRYWVAIGLLKREPEDWVSVKSLCPWLIGAQIIVVMLDSWHYLLGDGSGRMGSVGWMRQVGMTCGYHLIGIGVSGGIFYQMGLRSVMEVFGVWEVRGKDEL